MVLFLWVTGCKYCYNSFAIDERHTIKKYIVLAMMPSPKTNLSISRVVVRSSVQLTERREGQHLAPVPQSIFWECLTQFCCLFGQDTPIRQTGSLRFISFRYLSVNFQQYPNLARAFKIVTLVSEGNKVEPWSLADILVSIPSMQAIKCVVVGDGYEAYFHYY
jgi:hypothetical protein